MALMLLLPAAADAAQLKTEKLVAGATTQVAPGIFVIGAEQGPASTENGARNANITFVVGPTGVLVWNTGVSHLHGQALLAKILAQVDRPIRMAVISHAYQDVLFGWSAFAEIGIPVWMHQGTVQLMQRRCQNCLERLTDLLGQQAMLQTRLVEPAETLTGTRISNLIGRKIEIIDSGMSSGPNDLMLFDHESGILLAGATVMTDQLLEIRDGKQAGWLAALKTASALPIKLVVPDYGNPASAGAIDWTRQYFRGLDKSVSDLLKRGVTLADAVDAVPMPEFSNMGRFDEYHGHNVHQLFLRLESRYFD